MITYNHRERQSQQKRGVKKMNEYIKFLMVCIMLALITGAVIWMIERVETVIYNYRQKQRRNHRKSR
jgi:hypothetical protein